MVMDLVIWPATLVPVVFPTRLFRRELFPLGIFQSGTTLGFKRVPRDRERCYSNPHVAHAGVVLSVPKIRMHYQHIFCQITQHNCLPLVIVVTKNFEEIT